MRSLVASRYSRAHVRAARTTRDIDLALRAYSDVPREALIQAGFQHTGRFEHSDNWLSPVSSEHLQRTVQCSSRPRSRSSWGRWIARASSTSVICDTTSREAAADLVLLKLAAAEDPGRRASKREHDVGDVLALLEEQPQLTLAVPDLGGTPARKFARAR